MFPNPYFGFIKLNRDFIKLKYSFVKLSFGSNDVTPVSEEFIGFRKGTSLLVFPFFGCGFEMEFFGKKKVFLQDFSLFVF